MNQIIIKDVFDYNNWLQTANLQCPSYTLGEIDLDVYQGAKKIFESLIDYYKTPEMACEVSKDQIICQTLSDKNAFLTFSTCVNHPSMTLIDRETRAPFKTFHCSLSAIWKTLNCLGEDPHKNRSYELIDSKQMWEESAADQILKYHEKNSTLSLGKAFTKEISFEEMCEEGKCEKKWRTSYFGTIMVGTGFLFISALFLKKYITPFIKQQDHFFKVW